MVASSVPVLFQASTDQPGAALVLLVFVCADFLPAWSGCPGLSFRFAFAGRHPDDFVTERKWHEMIAMFVSTEKFILFHDRSGGFSSLDQTQSKVCNVDARRSAETYRYASAISRHFVFDGTCPIEDETVIFGVLSLTNP